MLNQLNRVRLLLDNASLAARGRMLVVRVTLTGECQAHADLIASSDETLNQVRGVAAELAAPDELWIESVVVGTKPELDLDAQRNSAMYVSSC